MIYIIIGTIVLIAGYFLSRNSSENVGVSDFKRINPGEAKQLIENEDVVLLDVRTPIEVSGGKIEQAININIASRSFRSEVSKLDLSKRYVVYCRSGRRSSKACSMMSGLGFTRLYNLEGGYNTWNQ